MATEVIHIIDPSNAAGTDYISLQAWVTAQRRNLVSANEIAIAECRGGRDYAFSALYVSFTDWTTDADHYIEIRNHSSEQNLGYFDDTKYYLDFNNSGDLIQFSAPHVRVHGIQFKITSATGANPLNFFGASGSPAPDWRFYNNVIYGLQANYGLYFGAIRAAGGQIICSNNMISNINGSSSGIYFYDSYSYATDLYVMNNSINADSIGIRCVDNGGFISYQHIRNNLVYDATTPFYPLETGTPNEWADNDTQNDYNFCDDSDNCNVLGSHGGNSATIYFESVTNGDLRLLDTAISVIGTGEDLSLNGTVPSVVKSILATDIAGNARGSIWDVGAFQLTISNNKYQMMI